MSLLSPTRSPRALDSHIAEGQAAVYIGMGPVEIHRVEKE